MKSECLPAACSQFTTSPKWQASDFDVASSSFLRHTSTSACDPEFLASFERTSTDGFCVPQFNHRFVWCVSFATLAGLAHLMTVATVEHKLDRGLPANVEAEKTILGSILLNNQNCNEAAESIVTDDFYLDAHRRIFGRMMDLSERGQAIDIITVTAELSRKKEV